ncbi:hypothetical protein [Endozoicomonas sp. 4G]|uniref:hypothetical protein n=1 Tax=Endozoicomonas sp. 4G TaxID=2872754 RepID=UPI0020787019|nr:hypothetical protein [Endozoicomonas sp. 4G]
MYKIHECDFLPKDGVSIVFSDSIINSDEAVWNLIIEREAIDEDLEDNHNLENVGDTIWQTVLEIYNCPFCSQTLSSDRVKNAAGNFAHINLSSWNSKRL